MLASAQISRRNNRHFEGRCRERFLPATKLELMTSHAPPLSAVHRKNNRMCTATEFVMCMPYQGIFIFFTDFSNNTHVRVLMNRLSLIQPHQKSKPRQAIQLTLDFMQVWVTICDVQSVRTNVLPHQTTKDCTK